MVFSPGYGETPLGGDELDALLPSVREALGDIPLKDELYDLEQAVQTEVAEELFSAVVDSTLGLDELLTDRFVRDLHRRLYADIWTWAGVFRLTELSIGVAPEKIAVDLRETLETISYRWHVIRDFTPRQLGVAVHAEALRIHAFADGNGRTTRLLADLVFAAAQNDDGLELYDWNLDKRRYVDLLRGFDQHRDVTELAEFISVKPLDV